MPWKLRTLTNSSLLTVQHLFKEVEALDVEFKEHHYAVIDLAGDDKQILDEEQAVMDDHEDKVEEITERMQQRYPESKAASLAAHSTNQCTHLGKWFRRVEISLRTVKGAV